MKLWNFGRITQVVGCSVLGLGLGLALSACTTGTSSAAGAASSAAVTSPASAPTATAQPAGSSPVVTSASAGTATPAVAASTAAATGTLVPMQTAAGGEFLSPSGNISCEVDYQKAALTQAYCQTVTPPRSVTMDAAGKYKTCAGQQCLGNPGLGTPTLAYGTATGVGPFRCESATSGVTCTAAGKGFLISAAGITPVTA